MYYYKFGTINKCRGVNDLIITDDFVDTLQRTINKKLPIPVVTTAPVGTFNLAVDPDNIAGYIVELKLQGNDIYLGINPVEDREYVIEKLVADNEECVKLRTAYMASITDVDYITYVKPDLTKAYPVLFFVEFEEFRKPSGRPNFVINPDKSLGDVKFAYDFLHDKFGINGIFDSNPYVVEPKDNVIVFEDPYLEVDKLHYAYIYTSLGIEHAVTFKNQELQKLVDGLDKTNCKEIISIYGYGATANHSIKFLTTKEFKLNEQP